MPFPLPLDPDFRKVVISDWLQDVEDRLVTSDLKGAKMSLKGAHDILLSLPPGKGDFALEAKYLAMRVKLEEYTLY